MTEDFTITQFEEGRTLEEVVRGLLNELRVNRNVYCQYHGLAPKQGFPIHRHVTTNEWTLIYNTEFDFLTRKGNIDNSVQTIRSINRVTAIYVPIGTCHTVRSRSSGFRYVVIKDGTDDFYWC